MVARFNNFVTAGYESWIGRRTDVWVVCDGNIVKRDESLFSEILLIVPLVRYDHPEEWDWRPERAFNLIPRSIVDQISKETGAHGKVWPSTGILAIAYFLTRFPVVYIHGFDFFKGTNHHYFQSKERNWNHDPEAEERYVQKLLDTGKVKLLSSLDPNKNPGRINA